MRDLVESFQWTIISMFWFGATGTILMLTIIGELIGEGFNAVSNILTTIGLVGVSVGFVGGFFWIFLVELPDIEQQRYTAALSGFITAFLSPSVVILFTFTTSQPSFFTSTYTSIYAIALYFIIFGNIFLGWLTLPFGTISGYLIGRLREEYPSIKSIYQN